MRRKRPPPHRRPLHPFAPGIEQVSRQPFPRLLPRRHKPPPRHHQVPLARLLVRPHNRLQRRRPHILIRLKLQFLKPTHNLKRLRNPLLIRLPHIPPTHLANLPHTPNLSTT